MQDQVHIVRHGASHDQLGFGQELFKFEMLQKGIPLLLGGLRDELGGELLLHGALGPVLDLAGMEEAHVVLVLDSIDDCVSDRCSQGANLEAVDGIWSVHIPSTFGDS